MLEGTCHCGKIKWIVTADIKSVTACNCTICSRYGALWGYGYIDHDINVTGSSSLYRRQDGSSTDFHFCSYCGCLTHYISSKPGDDGKQWTAVNLRMCTDLRLIENLPIDHFDGSVSWKDLPCDGRTVKDMWF